MREYPKALYRAPGPLMIDGISCEMRVVSSAEDEAVCVAEGWGFVPAGADPVAPVVPADDAPVTRAELEQKAAELGIKVDGRWSDVRLTAEIEKAVP